MIVKLNNLHISPRKVRLVASLLKDLPVDEAEAQLGTRQGKAAKPLLKLLNSALANSKNNHKILPENLKISGIIVNQGPRLKRWMPRARGSVSLIEKKSSHVILTLEVMSKSLTPRFRIAARDLKKLKKERLARKRRGKPEFERKPDEVKVIARKEGFFRKIFRRKAI